MREKKNDGQGWSLDEWTHDYKRPGAAKRFVSSLVTTLTVAASVLTIMPFIEGNNERKDNSPSAAAALSMQTPQRDGDQAELDAAGERGPCVLEHTAVNVNVSGYLARVSVKQHFRNPYSKKIEAVYKFPLPDSAAVDSMTMKIGDRTVTGTIKPNEQAREIYERAKNAGYAAALLEQERTNIFTQSIANVEPGKPIDIEIQFTEMLPFENGQFHFVFPTVIGPRFQPPGTGTAPDALAGTILRPDQIPVSRSGKDISINVDIASGVPITNVHSQLHQILVNQPDSTHAMISLKTATDSIPNKDFILSWDACHKSVSSGYLTHHGTKAKEGFLTAMVMPPRRINNAEIAPKEMIFLIDCSGSQAGAPLEKAQETMNYIVEHMNHDDTFQIIAFSDNVSQFAPRPELSNPEMKKRAHSFISALRANGGTWMAPAVEEACTLPTDKHRLRIVTFMTDGFVGNDYQIIGLVKRLRGTSRWFPFGTGNSVNRTLIDEIAKEGGGEPDYVTLTDSGEQVAKRFYERIQSPILTDLKLSWSGVELKDVYPQQISEVWAQHPLYFQARYSKPGKGKLKITGYMHGQPYTQELSLILPSVENNNSAIAQIWARAKIEDLMSQDWEGLQTGVVSNTLKQEITDTAVRYHILSQFTSFVAVDDVLTSAIQRQRNSQTAILAGSIMILRGRYLPVIACVAVGTAVVFGCVRGALQKTLSQSFSTVVGQLNSLNCYSAVPGAAGSSYPSQFSSANSYSSPSYSGSSSQYAHRSADSSSTASQFGNPNAANSSASNGASPSQWQSASSGTSPSLSSTIVGGTLTATVSPKVPATASASSTRSSPAIASGSSSSGAPGNADSEQGRYCLAVLIGLAFGILAYIRGGNGATTDTLSKSSK